MLNALKREARLSAISYWLPAETLDNYALSQRFPEWQVDKIAAKTGIKRRHKSAATESAGDLAFCAARALFEDNGIKPERIDFILLCTQSPDYPLPTTACILQKRLGVPSSAGALDFNLGCSGYVYGLSLASGLVASGAARNILLLTADTYTKFLHPEDKSCRTLFGDGATASLVSADGEGWKLGQFVFGTDGGGASHLIVANGGSRNRGMSGEDQRTESGIYVKNPDYLYMNGPEVFRFSTGIVPRLVEDVLAKNGIGRDEIDLFVFHQANKYMLDMIRLRAGIPEEKFLFSLEQTGNTVSSTIPIAIKNAWVEGRISFSDRLLLAGFGVGYSWAGCVVG